MLLRVNAAAVALLVVWCLTVNVSAQEKRDTKRDTKREKGSAVSVDAKNARVMLHRATEINGMKVRNSEGKELATVKDTIIDLRPGMVEYAVLSYGGFLGLGDKLFAVPWDALQHRHDVNNATPYFALDIDEATLKGSPAGFDDSHWPDFANPQWSSKIDTFYEKYRKPHAGLTVTTPRKEINVQVDVKGKNTDVASTEKMMLRGSALLGIKVKNETQKELGKVSDLVIEVHPGKIRYAALSYGGFLGLGDKLFAVPWKAFDFRHDISTKDFSLVLNIDEARLRKASGFDKNKWPDFADASITEELDKYYGVPDSTAAKPTTGGTIVRERKDR